MFRTRREPKWKLALILESDHVKPSPNTPIPTGEGTHGGPTVSHVALAPANETEGGEDVAAAFWALLAAIGYQVW